MAQWQTLGIGHHCRSVSLYGPRDVHLDRAGGGKLLVPAPQGMEAPQAVESLRGTGRAWERPADHCYGLPYTVLQAGIFRSGGCLSGTWWYATTHLSVGAANAEVIP